MTILAVVTKRAATDPKVDYHFHDAADHTHTHTHTHTCTRTRTHTHTHTHTHSHTHAHTHTRTHSRTHTHTHTHTPLCTWPDTDENNVSLGFPSQSRQPLKRCTAGSRVGRCSCSVVSVVQPSGRNWISDCLQLHMDLDLPKHYEVLNVLKLGARLSTAHFGIRKL